MIATSLATVPFTPPWLAGHDGAVVFHLRPASVIERGQFEATLAGPPYNAGRVFPWDLASAAEEAATALLDGDERGQVLAALSALRQTLDVDRLEAEHKQLLTAIEPVLSEHWPDYADLRRRDARRTELLPLLAIKMFLKGWDWPDHIFTTARDGSAGDDSIRQLSIFDIRAIGGEIYRLMTADPHTPLSLPLSKSAPAPPISPAAGGRRSAAKAGRSVISSGRKTRA